MTVTINNVNDDLFSALKKLVSNWQGVEIQTKENTTDDIQKKMKTAHKLFGMASPKDAEFIRTHRMNFSEKQCQ